MNLSKRAAGRPPAFVFAGGNNCPARLLDRTTFDDHLTLDYYRAFNRANRDEDDEEMERAFKLLRHADETVPIQNRPSFREAILRTAHHYRCRKIAQHMPIAHEEYRMNHSLGLRLPGSKDHDWSGIRKMYYDSILEGRKMNGEPENLDF